MSSQTSTRENERTQATRQGPSSSRVLALLTPPSGTAVPGVAIALGSDTSTGSWELGRHEVLWIAPHFCPFFFPFLVNSGVPR